MKRTVLLIALLALVLPACQKKDSNFVRIGVAGPMTGPEGKFGSDFKHGVAIAVDEWNSSGGVLGKKIEIITGDDQSDPKQAVLVANMIVNEGAAGVIGHFDSNCTKAASDVYNRAGIPVITPASTNPTITERGFKSIFRVCGRDDQQGGIAARFLTVKLKAKTVALIHDKTTYGQGLVDEFRKALGDKVKVTNYIGITKGDKDFKAVLTSIKEKNPEVIYFGGIYPEGGLLVKQARELGIKAPFMSGDGVFEPIFVQIAGKEAVEGTYVTFSPDPESIPTAKDFVRKYKSEYGDLGAYSIYAYDAMSILLRAIKEAGTTDGAAVSEKLHSMTFDCALGKIKFDSKGDVTASPYIIWVVRNGKFVEYWRP